MMFRNEHPHHNWEPTGIARAVRTFEPPAKTDSTPRAPSPLLPEIEMIERVRPHGAFTLEQRLCQLFGD
jgi:hypothetical protein